MAELGVDVTGQSCPGDCVFLQPTGARVLVDFGLRTVKILSPGGILTHQGQFVLDSSSPDRITWQGTLNQQAMQGLVLLDNEADSVMVQWVLGGQASRTRIVLEKVEAGTFLCTPINGHRTVTAVAGQLRQRGIDLRNSEVVRISDRLSGALLCWDRPSGAMTVSLPGVGEFEGQVQLDTSHLCRVKLDGVFDGKLVHGHLLPTDAGSFLLQVTAQDNQNRSTYRINVHVLGSAEDGTAEVDIDPNY